MKNIAYICMGSNLGEAPAHLAEASALAASLPGVELRAASSVYCTEPQDKKEQAWFYNQTLKLECRAITADDLLDGLQSIENRMGRERNALDRFGPRVIDLDLLLFGMETRPEEENARLILPHPRMTQRAFVLVPLHEIAPGLILPDGQSVADLLRALPHQVDGDRIYQ